MAMIAAVAMALPSASETALLVAAAFGTAMLSAITGFGGGVLLLAACVGVLGPRTAVVVVTIAQLASTGGRMWFNRTEISRHLVGVFSLGAVPGAVVGALLLTATPPHTHSRIIGGFLLALVLWRRFHPATLFLPDGGLVCRQRPGGLNRDGPIGRSRPAARGLLQNACLSPIRPTLPTWALQQVVGYVRYSGHDVDVVATAALDPKRPSSAVLIFGPSSDGWRVRSAQRNSRRRTVLDNRNLTDYFGRQ